MIETLLALDHKLAGIIVFDFKNSFFDFIMPILSNSKLWTAPFVIIIFFLCTLGKKKGIATTIVLLITVAITDLICGGILKDIFHRARPLSSSFTSFPSCHAANTFAAAMVFAYFYKNILCRFLVFGIAIAVGFSRVYILAHYPLDVIGGIFFGGLIAFIVIHLLKSNANKYIQGQLFNAK
jgi:undecaprenyl-diphosphatase